MNHLEHAAFLVVTVFRGNNSFSDDKEAHRACLDVEAHYGIPHLHLGAHARVERLFNLADTMDPLGRAVVWGLAVIVTGHGEMENDAWCAINDAEAETRTNWAAMDEIYEMARDHHRHVAHELAKIAERITDAEDE